MSALVMGCAILLLVVVGCQPANTTTSGSVSRYVDPDYRVTCWYTGSYQGGIACLPDSQVVAR